MGIQNLIQELRFKYLKSKSMTIKLGDKAWEKVPTKAQTEEFANKTKKAIDSSLKNVNKETRETKDMAKSFFNLLHSKLDLSNRKEPPSEKEVKDAIEQLKDIGRISVFATISIIPGGGFSLIGLEILAKKYGVKNFTFVPSAFRKKKTEDSSPDLPQEIGPNPTIEDE